MVKQWWLSRQPHEQRVWVILAALAICVIGWVAVIKPIDSRIEGLYTQAQKARDDIQWMNAQASKQGLLRYSSLKQPLKDLILNEAQREHLSIELEPTPDRRLNLKPTTLALENLSRWLISLQFTYGIIIDEFQFRVDAASGDRIVVERLTFRSA